jgi:hypothetical protein
VIAKLCKLLEMCSFFGIVFVVLSNFDCGVQNGHDELSVVSRVIEENFLFSFFVGSDEKKIADLDA